MALSDGKSNRSFQDADSAETADPRRAFPGSDGARRDGAAAREWRLRQGRAIPVCS